MSDNNYASASEVVRNLRQIRAKWDLLVEQDGFQIVKFAPPYVLGYEYWLVNDKGYLWEPADSEEQALNCLMEELKSGKVEE